MELNQNWLTSGLIDFEYKKYMLLGYLQWVKEHFNQKKLYPFLSDLVFHHNNLLQLKENKKLLYEQFPKTITRADFEKLQLVYEELVNDDNIMREIEDIISYSLPVMEQHLAEGKDIYETVEHALTFEPIGLTPLNRDAGYLMIHADGTSATDIYQYEITIFENRQEKHRGIHTRHVETVSRSIINTFESIKIYLLRKYTYLPNPATYLVCSRIELPMEETLLPVAKRILVRHLAA